MDAASVTPAAEGRLDPALASRHQTVPMGFADPIGTVCGRSFHSSRSSSVARSRFTSDEAAREVIAVAKRIDATIVDVVPSGIW